MYNKVYFIGIGGIGMSAIARYFNTKGICVSGYDKTETELTRQLVSEGIKIHYEDRPDLIDSDIDLVVITPAIPKDLKEYEKVLSHQYNVLKRSQLLGQITNGKPNIAVAGTHGKTTTSILLSHILMESNTALTAFLGGISVNYESNFLYTGDQWIVAEADEYDRSFLSLHPDIAVIGSLDADHLDIYGSKDEMIKNYFDFSMQVKPNGLLLMSDTINAMELNYFKNNLTGIRIEQFGFESSEIQIYNSSITQGWSTFSYSYKEHQLVDLSIRLPGNYNLRNAAASIRIAMELGINETQIRKALLSFKGIKRRFEWIDETQNKVLIDDYAHHPEELRAVISACKECYPGRQITGIFQPHLYSRTRDFMDAFAEVLSLLDIVILVEIYPAREKPIAGINSEVLFDKIKNKNKVLTEKSKLCNVLKGMNLDVVMTLGAGDLDTQMDQIKNAVFGKS
jgi:UDP-N-acetylmuramate--alanine ligase